MKNKMSPMGFLVLYQQSTKAKVKLESTIIWYMAAKSYEKFVSLLLIYNQLNIEQLLATNKLKYSEEELVAGLKLNDKTAFEFLYDHYSGALFNIISKTIRDEVKAADVLQESFLKIWKNIASYNPEKGRLFTWIMNIARNTAIDAIRAENRKPGMTDIDDRTVHEQQDVDVDLRASSSDLKAIVDLLRPERKLLVDMAYFQGYTHEEIAEKLSIPLGTVKSRIRTALHELKQYFAV
jgi:RNA polymerase sigma factor (sigma-70 family)